MKFLHASMLKHLKSIIVKNMTMSMFKPGEVCRFEWWTTYKAPSASEKTEWCELVPGDVGKIVSVYPDDEHGYSATVKFDRIGKAVKLRKSMLKKAA